MPHVLLDSLPRILLPIMSEIPQPSAGIGRAQSLNVGTGLKQSRESSFTGIGSVMSCIKAPFLTGLWSCICAIIAHVSTLPTCGLILRGKTCWMRGGRGGCPITLISPRETNTIEQRCLRRILKRFEDFIMKVCRSEQLRPVTGCMTLPLGIFARGLLGSTSKVEAKECAGDFLRAVLLPAAVPVALPTRPGVGLNRGDAALAWLARH